MTPGREALAEAMRLEQARIYSQLQHEHVSTGSSTAVCAHDVAPQRPTGSNVTRLAPPRKDKGAA